MIKNMLVGYIQDGRHSGIDKYLLNFCKVSADKGVHLDFLTDEIDPDMKAHLDSLGFGLYAIPSLKHPLKQYKVIKSIIEKNGYDGAYFNISEAFNCTGLYAAAKCGVPVRIVHSHSGGVDRQNRYVRALRTAIHGFMRNRIYKKATRRLACSNVAGEWMYPCNFEIIYNAVDGKRFEYSKSAREKIRAGFGIDENQTVAIHVGNFCYTKNQSFLMEVMASTDNAVLLCVGTGNDLDAVKAYAQTLNISDRVIFTGVRSDIPDLMSAADVFVFPSIFEGLPITCIEAQFSGIRCIVSDSISREVKISDNLIFLPLGNAGRWAEEINKITSAERKAAHLSKDSISHYELENQKKQLLDITEG